MINKYIIYSKLWNTEINFVEIVRPFYFCAFILFPKYVIIIRFNIVLDGILFYNGYYYIKNK